MLMERERRSTRRPVPDRRARRCHGDDGTIIAEAALLTPFFITLMFGMLEFGGLFRDYLTLANTTAAGARQAAIQGNVTDADYWILKSIKTASGAMPWSQVQQVIIYKANPPSAGSAPLNAPPSACLTGGQSGVCNTYSASDLAAFPATESLSWQQGTATDQGNWPASSRYVLVASPGPDYVGVYVKVLHPWITGLFGTNVTLTNNTTGQLEPQKLSS